MTCDGPLARDGVAHRLLLVSTEFPPGPGGIGTHAWQLARHLTRLGWEVQVLACQDYVSDAEIRDFNAAQPFEVVRFPSGQGVLKSLWSRGRSLQRQLATSPPDLMVASGLKSLWLVATRFAVRRPWVAVGHGSEFNVTRGWQRWLTRKALNSASRVVCVSEFTRERAIRLGMKRKATQVILNGADADDYYVSLAERPTTRQLLGPAVEQLLLTVGHVSERKAQDIVIRALPRILERFPGTHYAIAGIPSRQEQLTRLAESLGVAPHVHFLGRQTAPQLRAWFNACDLFVLTSRNTSTGDCEGFGIVAVEAALCGKPAVVTRDSGLAEAVIDGATGMTVPQEDPDATAEAICRLLGDRQLLQSFGAAALTRAREAFTWTHRVAEYDQLFRELIAPTRPDSTRPTPETAIA